MTWRTVLQAYRVGEPPLFDEAFLAQRGGAEWQPAEDDRAAAAKLHTQLVSRITTQRLGYTTGDERTALTSVAALFQQTRDIANDHPHARHFDALAWHVLNVHVRPFTAKWHARAEGGGLDALDATDEFRADLDALRPLMVQLDQLLLFIRDGEAAPGAVAGGSATNESVAEEMARSVEWGIPSGSRDTSSADVVEAINAAEKEAVQSRRNHYHLAQTPHATGLAISGGGIRSATFSLGVLVALAQRGLLAQFDYLSTVSGGGYLGSFLSTFLQSPGDEVGLRADQLPFARAEGEAAALRHIRHHSKYIAVGSAWERVKMATAQLLGMTLNTLAVCWLLFLAGLVEHSLRSFGLVTTGTTLRWLAWALAAGGLLSLIALRAGGPLHRYADACIAVPAALLAVALAWAGLDRLHVWYAAPSPLPAWSPGDKQLWIAIAGAVPVVAPVLATMLPRLLKRFGVVLVAISAIAAPLFLLGIYLILYQNTLRLATRFDLLGIAAAPWLAMAVIGSVLYALLFDINATSPHRHYRRKLGQAYLIQPAKGSATRFDEDVRIPLSELGRQVAKAPYHLLNCALNVPASKNIAMQGRLTDFFLFSPAYSGSPLIGYWPTRAWERLDAHLDLGTAMAISGGAAAPQMGLGTIRRFRFWLALLNVRLGYWARRPGPSRPTLGAPGLLYLLREMLGAMDEKGPWINLSDGGHIENLAIYELLRRRCKYIVAIDGEEDAGMTFHGLTTLQRLAAIDLGVSIDLDLDDLRLNKEGLSRSHFRFCRVRYPKLPRGQGEDFGYLLYLKLSLTGNEGEFIRRYRLDEPAFPHHSTADQFFSEAQFEAYRSLGEHVGNKLFLRAIVGDLGKTGAIDVEEWFRRLGMSLLESVSGGGR
jgi:hypothetical protein